MNVSRRLFLCVAVAPILALGYERRNVPPISTLVKTLTPLSDIIFSSSIREEKIAEMIEDLTIKLVLDRNGYVNSEKLRQGNLISFKGFIYTQSELDLYTVATYLNSMTNS